MPWPLVRDMEGVQANSEPVAFLRGPDGAAYSSRARFDSEALTEHAGKYCVGVERQNEIVCFDYAKQGLLAHGQTIAVPAVVKTFPNNQGLEAVVGVPGGQELAERLSDNFDTRVKVELGQRKGRIVVEFGSVDDLERIIQLMSPEAAHRAQKTDI